MSNPNPTPHLENLRPPWQPGTSGNPAGYSHGRRISDAIEQRMDELQLDGKFAGSCPLCETSVPGFGVIG
jgi:hypothetical protein